MYTRRSAIPTARIQESISCRTFASMENSRSHAIEIQCRNIRYITNYVSACGEWCVEGDKDDRNEMKVSQYRSLDPNCVIIRGTDAQSKSLSRRVRVLCVRATGVYVGVRALSPPHCESYCVVQFSSGHYPPTAHWTPLRSTLPYKYVFVVMKRLE